MGERQSGQWVMPGATQRNFQPSGLTETAAAPILRGMFCYKCGERLWDGRTSCQKCGADVSPAILEAENPSPDKWPLYAALLGLLAASAIGFALGRLVFHPLHSRPLVPETAESELITPMNVRDPSALVMGPREDQYCPCPAKKAK